MSEVYSEYALQTVAEFKGIVDVGCKLSRYGLDGAVAPKAAVVVRLH